MGSTIGGGGAATALTLTPLTSDPSLSTGKVWFRSDLKQFRYSPDGVAVYGIGATGPTSLSVYTSYAGANTFWGNNALKISTATVMTKLKEILLTKTPESTLRTYFGLLSSNTGTTVYAQVYRNGSAVGTLRSMADAGAYVYFTEDISGWANGDYYQIYGYTTNVTYAVRIANMQILCSTAPNPEISNTLV